MIGGLGNDQYYVDNVNDVITENPNEGRDKVFTTVSYTLSDNIEELVIQTNNGIQVIGNAIDNRITGNSGGDTLIGGAGKDRLYGKDGNDSLVGNDGNDLLNGEQGVDTMVGGLGNDRYIIDNINDIIIENPDEGKDTVQTSVSYTLTDNVENLSLTGENNINATGNSVGNSLKGNKGNNTLIGEGGNDVLNGGEGIDTMIGGLGNDRYTIDNINDVIIENPNEGKDTIQTSISYTLPANFENLSLTGENNINATGNSVGNSLKGNKGNNTLIGEGGNDALNGGEGIDTMIGGVGNDRYTIDNINDVIIELANEGKDTVLTSITYTLPANFENLSLTGNNNISGFGNSVANRLQGNNANNTLTGEGGNDNLIGKNGDDILNGGIGRDIFTGGLDNDELYLGLNDGSDDLIKYSAGEGEDTIFEFEINNDLFWFQNIDFIDVKVVGSDTQLRVGNGTVGDAGFGEGSLLATVIGVNNFTDSQLGDNGSNLYRRNTAQFAFS